MGPKVGSWVITMPNGVVFETFKQDTADKARVAGWKVEAIGDYLGRINRAIKGR